MVNYYKVGLLGQKINSSCGNVAQVVEHLPVMCEALSLKLQNRQKIHIKIFLIIVKFPIRVVPIFIPTCYIQEYQQSMLLCLLILPD
jgi:hypothetical protein